MFLEVRERIIYFSKQAKQVADCYAERSFIVKQLQKVKIKEERDEVRKGKEEGGKR